MTRTVEICPVCRKASLTLHLGGYLGKVYRCGNCDYVGPVVIEMELDEYMRMMADPGDSQNDSVSRLRNSSA